MTNLCKSKYLSATEIVISEDSFDLKALLSIRIPIASYTSGRTNAFTTVGRSMALTVASTGSGSAMPSKGLCVSDPRGMRKEWRLNLY